MVSAVIETFTNIQIPEKGIKCDNGKHTIHTGIHVMPLQRTLILLFSVCICNHKLHFQCTSLTANVLLFQTFDCSMNLRLSYT